MLPSSPALAVAAADDRIPTLEAFLAASPGATPLIVEIKSRFDGDLTADEPHGRRSSPPTTARWP